MGARVTWLDIGGFRSEWRNDIILFSQYGLRSEYYHPFTPTTHWFIAPRVLAVQRSFLLLRQQSTRLHLSQELWRRRPRRGLPVRKCRRTASRLRRRLGRFQRQVGNPNELPSFSGAYAAARVQYRLDRLDDACDSSQGTGRASRFPVVEQQSTGGGAYPVAGGRVSELLQAERTVVGVLERICRHDLQSLRHWFAAILVWVARERLVAYGTNELLMDKYFLVPGGLSPAAGEAAAAPGQRHLFPGDVRGRAGLRPAFIA